MSKNGTNVAILGQTGVGKSSLINYLFNEPKRKTGSGKPVTEQGFFEEQLLLNGLPVCLIDSWGIEQGKDEEWFADLKKFLEEKGIQKPVNEWLHIAIYCISAACNRVQDFDIKVVKELKKQNIDVVVALTKAGLVSDETITEMSDVLYAEVAIDLSIVPVNSVSKTLMGGHSIPQMGLEKIVSKIRINYINMLRKRLPSRIHYLLENKIKEYYSEILFSSNGKVAAVVAETLSKQFIEKDIEQIITNEIQASVESYVHTISITLPDDEFKVNRLNIGDAIIKSFVGVGLGTLLRMIHPILGVLVTVGSIIKAINKKPEEIAGAFQKHLVDYMVKNDEAFKKIILDALDSMEKQINEAMQV